MSHRREKRARRAARATNAALITAASLEALCIFTPVTAYAQAQGTTTASPSTAASGALEEVVVTGFRYSLQSALDAKRESDLQIESVAPEDIGKMPDQNVAEALQRLPGVQIDRSQGFGTAVLIDGLRQNLTTLNGDTFLTGREYYVSGEASGGGSGSNAQYASLEGVPSEEISGIDVYKNPKASMTEGGLGGTIDLKTRDPLAQPDGLSLAGNYREADAQRGTGWTPNGTLVGAFKVNDRLGFTASVSYDKEDTHTHEFQAENRSEWIITNSATGPYTGALTPAGISTLPSSAANGGYYIQPQLAYFSDILDDRKTTGASFGAAFKWSDSVKTNLNYFYSREDDTNTTFSDKLWFNGQGAQPWKAGNYYPGIDPSQPYSIDGNGVVQSGTFNANGAETATLYQHTLAQANNFQLITRFDNGGPVRAVLDASLSHATSDLEAAQADVEHGLYTTSGGTATSPAAPGCNNGGSTCTNATGSHGYEFTYANGGTSGLPSFSYVAPYADILSNPAYTTFKSNWAWANLTDEKTWAIKLDVQYDPGFIQGIASTLSAGVRYSNTDLDQTFGRYLINGTEGNGQVAGSGPSVCGAGNVCGPWLYYQDPGYGTPNIPYSTATSNPGLALTYNNFAAGNIIVKNPATSGITNPATYLNSVWTGAGVPNTTEAFFKDGLSSFDVSEGTTAFYLMGDLGGPANHFHLNYGVRVVDTDITINGGQSALAPAYYGTASWNGVDSNVVPIQTKRNYIDVLPSFNLVLDVTDTQKVRLGAARVMSPTDLFLLGVGNSYGYTRSGSGGNFVFDGGSSGNPNLDPYRATQFALSYENYFTPGGLVSIAPFYKQVDNFIEIQNVAVTIGGTTADVSQPVNAGKGRIYGIEFGAQYAFGDEFAAWLKGFGVAANYTRSNSESDEVTSFTTRAGIPGVSKDAVTGQVYYERYGFSARASYSWRGTAISDGLGGSTFSFADQNGNQKTYQIFQAPYGQLDAQLGYNFNAHIGVFASVQNLTDAAQHTYLQWPNQPFQYDDSGRRYFIGIKGKL
jgi:TonB-dependent receptor